MSDNIEPKESCGCSEAEGIDTELNKKLLRAFLKNNDSVEAALHEDLGHIPDFTTFSWKHMKTVHEVADNLVNEHGDDVDKIIDKLSALKNVYPNSAYADYLSRISFYKHPETKNLVCPPIHEVLPESCFSLEQLRESDVECDSFERKAQKESIPSATILASPQSLNLESKLDWWREDIQLSEHHANWHAYYPFTKKLDTEKVRRGELFAYMHEQMLARYDFERFAVGLPPVKPFGPGVFWDKPLPEGYNIDLHRFSARPGHMSIPDRILFHGQPYVIKDMELHKERLLDAIARMKFLDPSGERVPVTMDGLGCTVESDENSVNPGYYGNLHNMGHVVIAMMNDPDGRYVIHKGPMYQQYTAARDPVFFRWHKFIDSLFEECRLQMKPRDPIDLNIQLAYTSLKVKKVSIMTDPVSDLKIEKDCLYTKMTKQTFTVYWAKGTTPAGDDKPYEKRYINYPTLEHCPFDYQFTIELKREIYDSTASIPTECPEDSDINTYKLMFRVFMAPETQVTDLNQRRRHFIELDSFVQEIKWDLPNLGDTQKFEITRKSKDSTVAMQPIPHIKNINDGNLGNSKSFCGCGWPLNLLIPRGTPTGMKADLFVLVTDWEKDAYDKDAEFTGGAAYCGKSGKPYPDKKPMGYPFDRNFKFHKRDFSTLQDVVGVIPNSATIPVTIKFLGQEVEK